MARARRPWGVVAGPITLGVGMVVFWGSQSALAMKERVIDWSYQLEHSGQPVSMQMPDLPLVPPLFINSDNLGRIDLVVVQRNRPGSVDSLTIVANVPARFHNRLENCDLRLRVTSFDWHGYTHALRCTSGVDGLLAFGHLRVKDSNIEVPIMVRPEDLPCDHNLVHGNTACGKTTERLRRELRLMQRELAEEARRMESEIRVEAEQIRRETRQIREDVRRDVRAAVRSIR